MLRARDLCGGRLVTGVPTANEYAPRRIFVHMRSSGICGVYDSRGRRRQPFRPQVLRIFSCREGEQSALLHWAWLRSVVLGHYRYYGVPHNAKALQRFRKEVARLWQRSLSRRSQKGYVTWDRMKRYVDKWLPVARIYHPHPDQRFGVTT